MYITPVRPDELYHFGIKNMHWGIRRFQNKDGTLTPAGRERYGKGGFEGYRSRVDRAKNAAVIEDNYNRVERKIVEASSRNNTADVERFDRAKEVLRNNYDRIAQNLTNDELELGRKMLEVDKMTAVGAISGGILAGPVGAIVIGAGTRVASSIDTKIGKTRKKVRNAAADRWEEYMRTTRRK